MAGPPPFIRKQMAAQGKALPGGRFPINNEADLKKAIRLAGNAKGDPAAVRSFIKKRAAALGLTRLIPDGWK